MTGRRRAAERVATRFAAGAVAVLGPHQAALALLHRAGVSPWPGYDARPTAPLGVPAFASAALWGGAWGVALVPLVVRSGAARPLRTAASGAVLGAVLPTAVGAALALAGHRAMAPGARPLAALGVGLGVNALWGLATVALAGALVRDGHA